MSDQTQPNPSDNAMWGAAWDSFLQSRDDTGFMQSWNYAQVGMKVGINYFDAFLCNDKREILAGGRVFIRETAPGEAYFFIPDGPTLSADPAIAQAQFQGLLSYLDQMQQQHQSIVTHVRMEPRWTEPPEFIDPAVFVDGWLEPRHTIYVDLTVSEEEMLARMKYKGRYNVRKAIRNDIKIIQDNTQRGFSDLVDLYKRTLSRKGVDSLDANYLSALFETFHANDQASLFFAEHQGRRIVGGLIIYFGKRATYFFTGSDIAHSKLKAPYLMTWEIMRDAKRRGHKHYDLYGIAPPGEKDHPYTNFTQFKTMFGGDEVHMIPTMDFIYDQRAYRAQNDKE